jgi:putative hydrolase of the HAD superfamily
MRIDIVGVDADDTLWHSEGHFHETESRFCEILAPWAEADLVSSSLLDTERGNLSRFGYGVKGFTLSMIETAIELSAFRIDAHGVEAIIELGKALHDHPVELIDGVEATLTGLAMDYRLVLVTKGDLFHQESKVAASGIADIFERVEIVAEKDVATYTRILGEMASAPNRFCMIGNSIKSDIAPVLDAGGAGVHIPYHLTWAMERAELDTGRPRFARVDSIREAPEAVALLSAASR